MSSMISFTHGGAFIVGSSKDIGFNQVKWFLRHGVACVSLEYRLLPQQVYQSAIYARSVDL
jgi:acetyl esterase/lipase